MQNERLRPESEASSLCKLNPVTSLSTARYDNAGCVQLSPRVIYRGPASRSSACSASKWGRLVHPEGQPYFILTGIFSFTVVTEANVEDVQTEGRILDCAKIANKELQAHSIEVPPRSELFLELGDDHVVCNYYFVDHVGRGLFWLDDICTELLDIPAAASPSHLDTALERLYWVHLEFFPMHHGSHEQEFSHLVDELYNIISHGHADRLTSRTSTFPYTANMCKQFLKLLSRKRGQRVDGYTLCYAARLAGAITNQRFVTFYGQQSAQLDRLQEMFPADVLEHRWMSSVANLLMWGVPRQYNSVLEDLYVNEQVYADQWTHFVSTCLADWKTSLSWSFPVLISSILLASVRGGMIVISLPSVLSCAVSIASASCLHLRHQPLAESSAAVGARYLRFAKWDGVAFLPSSVVFSLPRAGCLWGVAFLTAQFLFIVSHAVNRWVAVVAACVIAAILVFMFSVIHPEDASVASWFKSLASLCIPRLYALDARQDEPMV